MKKKVKVIFHIDLNAFYATCAMIEEPYLKDKVFVVGGSSTLRKGVISTASYAARRLGIRSAMNINDAMRIYPKLLVVPLDFKLYKKHSNIFFNFLKAYSSIILKGSIDEAYIDMTELSLKRHPMEIAKEIQEKLRTLYHLPVSIGIGPTLFLAKMASDMKKPLGITVLRKSDIVRVLFKLPIEDMFGIGRKTYPILKEKGIRTIGDFTKKENELSILDVMSETSYKQYLDDILGRSSDIIDPNKYKTPKSISNEETLAYPIDKVDIILEHLTQLLDYVHRRLLSYHMLAKTVGIRLKNQNFEAKTRSLTFHKHTSQLETFKEAIETLLEEHYHQEPVRLVGVYLQGLVSDKEYKQEINLFNYQEQDTLK